MPRRSRQEQSGWAQSNAGHMRETRFITLWVLPNFPLTKLAQKYLIWIVKLDTGLFFAIVKLLGLCCKGL
jgi:hypothetical protein